MLESAYLIPIYPLFAFAIIIFFIRWNQRLSAWLSIAMILTALVHSVLVLIAMISRHGVPYEVSSPFIEHPKIFLEIGMWIDPLTAVMLVVVTFVASCVQIYSLGYMHGDPRWSRYFSYLSLFTFSMLGLVIANNFFMIFIFWELVGLTSYLLIGFWFEKKSASDAGKKAFIANRVGDFGFIIGIILLMAYGGTVNYQEIFGKVSAGAIPPGILTMAGIFLFCGAVGKSAQFPLHVWLPDAMEGPTPVSALIHAATMVAAGVYMVARGMTIFAGSAEASTVIATIGLITSFMAATIALTQIDIKRVLAYSTCSQLGYMIMALGLYGIDYAHGHHSVGYYAGTFHLMTHAFFKALLFLGAGSVIHAVHTNDIFEMGGLRNKMKITRATFLIACLSISGIFPFSGFFSKDEIVAAASTHPIFAIGTLLIAFMTAFYMFRLYYLTFSGEPRNQHRFDHAHESPKSMTYPLMALAFLSIFAGWTGLPFDWFGLPSFSHFVYHGELHEHHASYFLMFVSLLVAGSGIMIAAMFYYWKKWSPEAVKAKFLPIQKFLFNKWYIDELYQFAIIDPTLKIARKLWWFDAGVVDGLVNFFGWFTVKWADAKMLFDKYIIDGAVNGAGYVCMTASFFLRFIQTGKVQFYAFVIILSVTGIVIYKITPSGALTYLIGVLVIGGVSLVVRMSRAERAEVE